MSQMTTLFAGTYGKIPPRLEESMHRIEQRQLRDEGRRASDHGEPPSWVQSLSNVMAIVAVVSAAFTVGYNWHEITALREAFATQVAQNQKEHESYALRAIEEEHYRHVLQQLEELKALMKAGRR